MKPLSRARLPLPPRPSPLRPSSAPEAYPVRPPLPPGQMTLLRLLALRGGTANLAELADNVDLRAQATHDAVERLTGLGLVELRQHPLLPNHATVALTPFGRHTVREGR